MIICHKSVVQFLVSMKIKLYEKSLSASYFLLFSYRNMEKISESFYKIIFVAKIIFKTIKIRNVQFPT